MDGDLPGPVAATYEAGPTGFGLARALIAAGIDCSVAAPSKLQRPSGDRVKTDARDARHLARLLHLGQIAEVTIPGIEQEAARDFVRAREDCRGDLMSARHRVSKLLLRQGIVYYGGKAWTAKHEQWLRRHRFDTPALQLAYDAAFDAMLATLDRRDRLDRAITAMAADSAFTPVVSRLQLCAGHFHVDRVRFGGRDRRLESAVGPGDRQLSGLGAQRTLLGVLAVPGRGHQDRQQPRPPAAHRSDVASPSALPARARSTPALGGGDPGGPGARPRCQPALARALDQV